MTEEQIDKADTSSLLFNTNRQVKTLIMNLNKVVIAAEDQHTEIFEGFPKEIEVIEEISINLKLKLKDKNPPCSI